MCLVCLSAFRLSCLFVCLSLCLSGCLLECVCRESFVLKQSTRLAVHLQPIKLSIFHASSRWNKQGERKAIDHKMCFLGKTNYHEEAFFIFYYDYYFFPFFWHPHENSLRKIIQTTTQKKESLSLPLSSFSVIEQ